MENRQDQNLYSTAAAAAAADKEFVLDGHLHNYIHKRAHQTNMNSNLYGSMKWRASSSPSVWDLSSERSYYGGARDASKNTT